MNSSTIIKYFTFRKQSSAQLGHISCSIKSFKLFIFARSFLQGLYRGFQLHLPSNLHQILYSGTHLCQLKICPIIRLRFCTGYFISLFIIYFHILLEFPNLLWVTDNFILHFVTEQYMIGEKQRSVKTENGLAFQIIL